MSEDLKARFINALSSVIVLYDDTIAEQNKRIEQLIRDLQEQSLEIGRLRQTLRDHARWFHELLNESKTDVR